MTARSAKYLFAQLDLAAMLRGILEQAPHAERHLARLPRAELKLDRSRPSDTAATVTLDLQPRSRDWVVTTGPATSDDGGQHLGPRADRGIRKFCSDCSSA